MITMDSPNAGLKLARLFLVALLTTIAAGAQESSAQDGSAQQNGELETRAPVLLRDSMLLTPSGTTCTGIAPEVKLRMSIDERGRVTDVEILDVEPSTELDDVFRRATVDTVKTWRYAPAIVDGKPAAKDLEWSVKFRPKEGFVPNPERRSTADTVFQAEDAAERRVDTSLLSPKEREDLLRCYSKVAEKHIDSAHRQRFDSPRFVVVTDSPQEGAAQSLANNLEASFHALTQIFQPAMDLQPSRLKQIVYVFNTKEPLHRTIRELGVASPWKGGLYLPPGFFLFHLQLRSNEELMHLLLHESVHAFTDRYLVHPGFAFPLWMEEGFAEYFGNSTIKDGQLIPGKTLRRKYVMIPFWGVGRTATGQGWDVRRVKQSIADDEEIRLTDLLDSEHLTFFGEGRFLFYPTAWLFVHFLRHAGDDQTADDRFATVALYLAEGYSARDALRTVYGMSLEELEKRFVRYVRRF